MVVIALEDDDGNLLEIKLENALYFPQSPVNIVIIVCLADTYKDDEGTFIKTSRFSSEFHWNFGKYIKTICHADSRIPEIEVTKPSYHYTSLSSIATWFHGPAVPSIFMAKANFQEPHFKVIPDDEDESFSDMSPLKQDDDEDSNDDSIEVRIIPEFKTGDTLIYCRDGHEDTVTLTSHSFDPESKILKYEIKVDNERTLSTARKFLRPSNEPDTITLPSSIKDYKILAEDLSQEDLAHILHPQGLSSLEAEYLEAHGKLTHTPNAEMFQLCEHGYLPAKFLKLKTKAPPYMSYIFGKLQRRKWRNKGGVSSIRKHSHNKPGKFAT